MANPQVEDGYIRIANELVDAFARTNLSSYQTRILWAIWRKTYGWNKVEDWISNSQLVEMTGLRKQHVSRTVKELIDRNIVTKSGNKSGFNKDYTQWRELPKKVTVTCRGNKVTYIGEHKRHYTKDKSIKDTVERLDPTPYERIISYLNEKTGKAFKATTKGTKRLIKAKWNEGFTEEDFRTVIDIKSGQWIQDEKMNRYLRPDTLFSGKFEGYLNEGKAQGKPLKEDSIARRMRLMGIKDE